MKFPAPIQKGKLVKRYKRFIADIDMGGKIITAHVANPGSMMGLKEDGATCWVSAVDNPKRKLQYDWHVVEVGPKHVPVCVNTALPNRIVEEAILAGKIKELAGYKSVKREVPAGMSSRLDFYLSDGKNPPCYVEIKNVTLSRKAGLAEFPDSTSDRASKQLGDMILASQSGIKSYVFYLVNRPDCHEFDLARDIDPKYAEMSAKALKAGIGQLAYSTQIDESGITVDSPLKIKLNA